MINSTLKTTIRHLWRNKLFTGLNIIGLAIGISACWMVFSIVHYEFSFDKKIPDVENIYQIISTDPNDKDGDFAGVPLGMAPLMDTESLDDAQVIPIYTQYFERLFISQGHDREELVFDEQWDIIATKEAYFEMLPYEWIVGNSKTAFSDPNHIILTEEIAKKYFPDDAPDQLMGRTVRADTITMTVAGIVKNLPFPTSFKSQVFLPIRDKEWFDDSWHSMNSNHILYIKTTNKSSLDHLIGLAQKRYDEVAGKDHAQYGMSLAFQPYPLSQKHFYRQIDTSGLSADKKVLYGLMVIGGFLLLLACINYINLSTAQVPQRAREIGIRKTLGATPRSLTWGFLIETACIALLAVLISWPLVFLFRQLYPEFIPTGMLEYEQLGLIILFLIGLTALISLFSGLYPTYLINKVQAIETLKGNVETQIKGTKLTLRKSLIVFQFIIAQFFIVSALIIGQQLNFTLTKDLGFTHDAIVTLQMPYKSYQNADVDPFLYKQALAKHPEIAAVAMGHEPQSNNHWGSIYYFASDTGQVQLMTPRKYVDSDFVDLYNVELLAGRNIHQTDTMREVLINETALHMLGMTSPEQAIGQHLTPGLDIAFSYPIVGVFKDFHQKSLKAEIEPLVLGTSNRRSNLQMFHIKLPTDRSLWSKSFGIMEQEWKTLYPHAPFEYKFVDEKIKNLYQSEHRTARLIGLATTVTILISCLGLFGLATLTAFQRTKEIGIRKVLGATVSSIIGLLSRDFIKLVCLAIIIASPIAWWAMNQWLEDFAYRINIPWWIFALAGSVAVIITLLTVSWQAVRAAIANPVESLRDE